MLTKEKLIETINSMPEDRFDDINILLERIVELEKIERGLDDLEKGNVHTHDEVGEIVKTWFKI